MSEEQKSEPNGHLAATWMRGDGTGYYFDCPTCHFYKNGSLGPCRKIGCNDTVVKVEIRTVSDALERDELIEKVAWIDYWGARGPGPAHSTARKIVDMLERDGHLKDRP